MASRFSRTWRRAPDLFMADHKGTRHIDCSKEPVSYFRRFIADGARPQRDRDAAGACVHGVPARARGAGESAADRRLAEGLIPKI